MDETAATPPWTRAAFAYAGVTVAALAALARLEGPLRAFRAPHAGSLLTGRDPIQGILWGVAAGVAIAAAGQGLTRWTPWGRRLTQLLTQTLGPLHPADAVLLAALSGLGEELVFRGLALPYLGLVGSSALFGLAHWVPRRGLWPWALWAAAAGLVLGRLAQATGGLAAPASAHIVINAVGLILMAGEASADPP
ncbi:MAG: CPBP family intramembrane metalloprotease [Deltaproteobacteria bacterium]|nr:CPBP family intramembrane metalloprotease [Deltaproteobacteria bacterium]